MTEKTWAITYLNDTPSLEIEAESLVKAVEKVKDKLPSEDLTGADFSCANFKAANLRGANLVGANLEGVKGLYINCPEIGSFMAFKKLGDGLIAKLEIPEYAKRSSATSRKCRASEVKVLEIFSIDNHEEKHE